MANVTKTLSAAEVATFERLETTIAQGKKTFIEVGKALLQIQTFRLYRKDYDTWEVYCQKRWGFTGRRGNQLINSTVALEPLTKDLGSMFPISERAAKEVIKVPEAKRLKVIKEAASNGLLSARSIKEAASKIAPKHEPEPPRDELGFLIPKECLAVWNRRQEIQDLLTQVSRLKIMLQKKHAEEDPLYFPIPNYTAENIEQIYFLLGHAKPYAVCTSCNGYPMKLNPPCVFCSGTGFISKNNWDTKAPVEAKELRKKKCA